MAAGRHSSGSNAPHSERIGAPESDGAGQLRMAGNIYGNPQSKSTKIKMGGNFEGGQPFTPKKMSVEKEGE